jgi:peptidyl-prolyl cis-trans isomerase C
MKAAWFSRGAREPLLQFTVVALVIWFVLGRGASDDRYVLDVGPAERQRIAESYRAQFGEPPSDGQLRALVARHIRDEIFFREGRALQLDQHDEIIRRRLIQKYEFLRMDSSVPAEPDAETLERWYERNQARYEVSGRVSFIHAYFSPDMGGEGVAKRRAQDLLLKLRDASTFHPPEQGDAFPGSADIEGVDGEALERLFGKSGLGAQVFEVPVGRWAGPFRSGFGWHVVYVTERLPAVTPMLGAIRERVLLDYAAEQRDALNEQAFERLRARYTLRAAEAGP